MVICLTKTILFRILAIIMCYVIILKTGGDDPFILALELNICAFFLYYVFERVWNKFVNEESNQK